jgi:hypothetical protein
LLRRIPAAIRKANPDTEAAHKTPISDPIGVELRRRPVAKNIMWPSDYPHSETTFPHSHKTIEHNFKDVPEAERDWIIAGCTAPLRKVIFQIKRVFTILMMRNLAQDP